jgi:hypothetical protein
LKIETLNLDNIDIFLSCPPNKKAHFFTRNGLIVISVITAPLFCGEFTTIKNIGGFYQSGINCQQELFILNLKTERLDIKKSRTGRLY